MCVRSRYVAGVVVAAWILLRAVPALAEDRCPHPVARVVSAEGQVAVTTAPNTAQVSIKSGTEESLCVGDYLQIGRNSRAAVMLLETGQLLRLDQNTTFRILAPTHEGGGYLIDLLRGLLRLFSPVGHPLDVRTPYVTAGVQGTEFFVSFDPSKLDTKIGVIDGRVQVARGADRLSLSGGEAVIVPREGAPQRIRVQPSDAVQWTIYYPPAAWTLPKSEESKLDPRVVGAWHLREAGDLSTLAQALDSISPREALNGESLIRLAALLLSAGRADEATAALDRAETLGANSPLVPAFRSMIAVAQNRTADALALSDSAVSAASRTSDPSSMSVAAVARSYALQSARRLNEAREILANTPPGDPIVLARLAEIEFSLGDTDGARRAAERAVEIAPQLSLPHTILGFTALANFDFEGARSAFEHARALDPSDPLPRIGLGLTAIREGDMEAGRRELAIAVALDPQSSVARSYLGKAHAALKDFEAAAREWALAQAADPSDPTAPLYRAFAERSLNEPVAALRDLQQSIELNGNRAVYRSQLLLDQDLATRTTGLASVYRDVGFEQLALSEGFNAVNTDPASPAAHRFLSDTYLALPRHETASDSELLQSLLLQPLIVGPVQPRLSREGLGILDLRGPTRLGFSEFSPLFASDGLGALVDGFAGNNDTFGDNLVAYGVRQNLSFSAGQFVYRTAGIRANNRLDRDIQDVLFQPALSDSVSVLAEFRHSDLGGGDTNLLFDPNNFSASAHQTEDFRQYRLGGRYDVAPGLTLVGVWTREHLNSIDDTGHDFAIRSVTDGDFGEAAAYLSGRFVNAVAGGGYFYGHDKTIATFSGMSIPADITGIRHRNVWVYTNATPINHLRVTLGVSFDDFRSGFVSRDKLNPKLGISWEPLPGTTIRAAYFQTFKRTTVGGQTIEPTQIAGFNQLFDDVNATIARRSGVGIDQRITNQLFMGAEWSQRQLTVPVINVGPPANTVEQGWRERFGRAYLNWIPMDRFAVNAELRWEQFRRDPTASNPEEIASLDLLRIPVELRYFDPSGVFGLLRTSLIHERGTFLNSTGSGVFSGKSGFATVDAALGWRLPGRAAVGVIEVDNLFDSRFRFQDTDPTNPQVVPRLQVLARLTLGF